MARSLRFVVPVAALVAVYLLLSGMPTPAQTPPVGPGTEAPPAPPSTDKTPAGVEDAVKAFAAREYDKALTLLEPVVKSHPELPSPQMIVAQWFYQVQQTKNVLAAVERAIMSDATDPDPYILLAGIAQDDRRCTEADVLYGKAAELLKTYKNASRKTMLEERTLSGLAWVAEQRQQWEPAKKNLELLLAALKSSPAGKTDKEIAAKATIEAGTYQRLARAKFGLGDAAGCLADLRTAFQIDKKNMLTPEARLAQFYEQVGGNTKEVRAKNHGYAEEWFKRALQKYPDDFSTRLAVAKWYFGSLPPQLEDAKKEASEALRLDSTSFEAKVLRGIVYLWQKDFKAAEVDFQNAHLQKPSDVTATNDLALALCEQGDQEKTAKALGYAEDDVRMYHDSPDVLSTYAWVLYKAGQLPQANEQLRKAFQYSGGNTKEDYVYYAARMAYDGGRKDEAKKELDALLKSERPFMMRPEAKELKNKLDTETGS